MVVRPFIAALLAAAASAASAAPLTDPGRWSLAGGTHAMRLLGIAFLLLAAWNHRRDRRADIEKPED